MKKAIMSTLALAVAIMFGGFTSSSAHAQLLTSNTASSGSASGGVNTQHGTTTGPRNASSWSSSGGNSGYNNLGRTSSSGAAAVNSYGKSTSNAGAHTANALSNGSVSSTAKGLGNLRADTYVNGGSSEGNGAEEASNPLNFSSAGGRSSGSFMGKENALNASSLKGSAGSNGSTTVNSTFHNNVMSTSRFSSHGASFASLSGIENNRCAHASGSGSVNVAGNISGEGQSVVGNAAHGNYAMASVGGSALYGATANRQASGSDNTSGSTYSNITSTTATSRGSVSSSANTSPNR